ncbi:hypothetical protein SAMN05216244_4053 [Sediminibacillus halophilus]|uniref:Uncharacterized protein n=1 Tax=Sediminibacillus halophilus TaxID=482461 RepID=A0A1G9Y501_9BACI|nr:hypothetical protein SAMN05216244_4053 [Sediminibacillus halophilus]
MDCSLLSESCRMLKGSTKQIHELRSGVSPAKPGDGLPGRYRIKWHSLECNKGGTANNFVPFFGEEVFLFVLLFS